MFRFGTCDFDPLSGDVRRDGRVIRLRPQPAAVLIYLAERSGQLVGREELRQHVWGTGVHVRFDQGLNSCLKQIRRALGDDRRSPVYIETLSRRGYRFLPAVQKDDRPQLGSLRLPEDTIRQISSLLTETVMRLIATESARRF